MALRLLSRSTRVNVGIFFSGRRWWQEAGAVSSFTRRSLSVGGSSRLSFRFGTKIRLPRPHGLRKSLLFCSATFGVLFPIKSGLQKLCVCLQATLVRNGEFPTALLAAAGQYFASIFGLHARAVTVLVDALPTRGLVCTFHRCSIKICSVRKTERKGKLSF